MKVTEQRLRCKSEPIANNNSRRRRLLRNNAPMQSSPTWPASTSQLMVSLIISEPLFTNASNWTEKKSAVCSRGRRKSLKNIRGLTMKREKRPRTWLTIYRRWILTSRTCFKQRLLRWNNAFSKLTRLGRPSKTRSLSISLETSSTLVRLNSGEIRR